MTTKRKAQDAFGRPKGQLSAFAAARLAKQSKTTQVTQVQPEVDDDQPLDATAVAQLPYDGHHSDVPSDAESDEPSIVVAPSPKAVPNVRLSTGHINHPHGSHGAIDEPLTIALQNGESVTSVGEYEVYLLKGVATVYGTVLREGESRRVYAPSTHTLPCVVGRRGGTVAKLWHQNSSIRDLKQVSPLFRNIWTRVDSRRNFTPLQSTADDELQRSLVPLEIDKATDAVLARLSTEAESTARLTRIMAIGAKSSGKSTFNRILCNTLISKNTSGRVFYLDLDPGQPEFGPPGLVSLVEVKAPIIGPPFTHPASARSSRYRLLRSHAIAATSFKDDPAHYVACAKELLQHADRQYPLIVNSCGWVSGLGASVLQDLMQSLDVTQAVLLEPLDEAFTETLRASYSDTAFHRLSRQPVRPISRTPAESRNMQTLAYFHHRTGRYHPMPNSEPAWSSSAISSWRSWQVGYHGPQAGIQAIISYGTNPHPDFLAEVLDGSIVALVRVEKHAQEEAYDVARYTYAGAPSSSNRGDDAISISTLIQRTKDGLPYLPSSSTGANGPLDPRYSKCIGLALVRAIDTERRTMHLVTPLPESQIATLLDEQIAIVRGSFDAPDWAYLEDLAEDGERDVGLRVDRPWVSKSEAAGIEGAVWRLRHPPMAGDVR